MPLTAGTRLGPYEISDLIDVGGMGEVYRARDTRLGRLVAIKRLTSHVDRFEQEARAIASLNHPHICQIYDVGPDYLVLEYVDGVPLRGPLAADEALRLAIQIAGALEAAHRRGILHRDLKPANVMVIRGGRGESPDSPAVKLLDFGLAKLIGADADATRTMDGAVVGTAAYMSPEQAQGLAVDARSDVFSFGAVLYEMLAGSRAFGGTTTVQVLNAVLREDPPPLSVLPSIDRIVRRCLQKAPGRRFQTMSEVRAALEQAASEQAAHPAALEPSIAVLPFANMSADHDNEYFSDGLAEEIIHALTHIPGLKVIARTSAFAFKGQNTDVRRIAEALGVAHVLEGSVRKAGTRLRVTAQLVAAADGAHLWSERYDRELADVFAIQDEIARAIAGALEVKLAGEPRAHRYSPDLASYEAFLRGRHHVFRFTPESWTRGVDCFKQAIALDSRYARPHAELGLAHLLAATNGVGVLRETAATIRREARLALDLDPSDPGPNFLLGVLAAAHDYHWSEAAVRFSAALGRLPAGADVHWAYASFYLQPLGRFEEAAAEMQREVDLDPLNVAWRAVLSSHLTHAERYEEAIANAHRAIDVDPGHWLPYFILSEVYSASGAFDRAVAAAERARQIAPWHNMNTGMLAGVLARVGDTTRAHELIRGMNDTPLTAVGMTIYHLVRGDTDAAAEWYEGIIEMRSPFAVIFAHTPICRELRASPRWSRLARLMNLPKDAATGSMPL
jgi:serine/threonine-protein kinase